MRDAGRLMPTAWNASNLLAARAASPGARPAMLRAVSSRLLATLTSTTAATGMPAITIAATVTRMIITFTSGSVVTSPGGVPLLSIRSIRCHH